MKYELLFSIALHHEYFAEEGNADRPTPAVDQYFELVPTPETQARLQDYRLVLKKRPGRLQCYRPVNNDNMPLVTFSEAQFRFFLEIKQAGAFQFSDFSTSSEQIDIGDVLKGIVFPRYTNEGMAAPPELALETYEYEAKDQFRVPEENSDSTLNFFLKSTPLPGLGTSDFATQGIDGISISSYTEEMRRIAITGFGADTSRKPFWTTYPAIPAWASETFGLVDIVFSGASAAVDYLLRIAVSSSVWTYLLTSAEEITNPSDTLKILDGCDPDNPGKIAFSDISEADGTAFPIVEQLKAHRPGTFVYQASSTDEVSYKASIRKNICLQKTNVGTTDAILIADLPNPLPADQGISIIKIPSPQT